MALTFNNGVISRMLTETTLQIILGVTMFTVVILALVAFIIAAKQTSGFQMSILKSMVRKPSLSQPGINCYKPNAGLFLPSARGGGGSCAQCKCSWRRWWLYVAN